MKRFLCGLAGAAASLFMLAPASAQDKMIAREVTDGVVMMQNDRGSGNAAFVITPDGVLVFDSEITVVDQVLAEIRKRTDKPVRYFVISHTGADHATGAWGYRQDRPVFIASKRQMHDLYMQEKAEFEERKARNPQLADKELVHPDIGFEGSMTLQFGGLTFVLTEEGHGHSTSDVTVFIPQKRVMLMGDLTSSEIHPGQSESGNVFFASTQGWIASLDRVIARRLPVDTYVPGHGPAHVGRGVTDLEEQRQYFISLRDEVSKMVKGGATLDAILKDFVVPKDFEHYTRKQRLQNFLKLFYFQLIERGY